MKKTIRDSFWIWGHDAGAHHDPRLNWHIPGENKMAPWEGAQYLGGIPNCCRVIFAGKPEPPFDEASKELDSFKRVVWSIVGDKSSRRNNDGGDDLAEVLRQAAKHPNIIGAIVDDFFSGNGDARIPIDRFHEISEMLHRASLELWVVFYASLFNSNTLPWLDAVDVLTFWSWTTSELRSAEENIRRLKAMCPGKRCLAGCYIYDYGQSRPMDMESMTFQMDLYRRMLLAGNIDGVVVCSNTVADCGLEAPEYLRNWLNEHGDEVIG